MAVARPKAIDQLQLFALRPCNLRLKIDSPDRDHGWLAFKSAPPSPTSYMLDLRQEISPDFFQAYSLRLF